MKRSSFLILAVAMLISHLTSSCSSSACRSRVQESPSQSLADSLRSLIADIPAEIGVALIINGSDTVVVNNTDKYPLMSVFKLHQAVALYRHLAETGVSVDSILTVAREELNPDTWSPILSEYTVPLFHISINRLVEYTLTQSDNNASNILFKRLLDVEHTDSIITAILPDKGFKLKYTEEQMHSNHVLCYGNHSSPFAVAQLLEALFTDSIMPAESNRLICDNLRNCATGIDRISQPIADIPGVVIAHKTGSGYRNPDGILTAHNDAAYIILPNGTHYTLVILVKDSALDEADTSTAISLISEMVYRYIVSRDDRAHCGVST